VDNHKARVESVSMAHPHKNPRRLPENEAEARPEGRRWGLSPGEIILSILGFFTLLAASLVVPEVRSKLHLKSEAPPAPTAPVAKTDEPKTGAEPSQEIEPKFQITPMPEKSTIKKDSLLTASKKPPPAEMRLQSAQADLPITPNGQQARKKIWGKSAEVAPLGDDGKPIQGQIAWRPELSEVDSTKILERRVDPIYPPEAKASGISGGVTLLVLVNGDGTVERVDYVDGPEILGHAAERAIKEWKYKPYIVDGNVIPKWLTTVEIFFAPQPKGEN
jgi:protein TonB